MNIDELNDLEETLAFIDQCVPKLTNFVSGQSSDESASSLQDISPYQEEYWSRNHSRVHDQVNSNVQEIFQVKAKLATPGRNRSRDLQKLELLQLRVEAAELQEQVDDLRATSREEGYSSEFCNGQSNDVRLEAWGSLVDKQKKLRREAEAENQYLRELVDGQIKTTKTLKRLFQRQAIGKKPSPWLSRRFDVNPISESTTENIVVLEELGSSLSDLLTETDCILQSKGLSATSPWSKTNTETISRTVTRIEIVKCELLPFDYRELGEAFMEKMESNFNSEQESKHIPSTLKQKVVVRSPTLEINDHVKIRYHFSGIKHTEKNRVIIVVSARNTLLEAFGEVLDDFQYQEKTWCVFSEASPGVCLLQLSTSMSLETKSVLRGRQEFVDKICELLVHVYREMFDSVQRDVELRMLAI